MLPPPPRAVLKISAALGALLALSALARIAQALLASPPHWFLLGFEAIVLVAAAIAVLLARADRPGFREGPALGLACVAGAVFVCSILGTVTKLAASDLRTIFTDPFTLARMLFAGAFGALAAITIFARAPRKAAKSLATGGVLLAVAVVIPAAWLVPPLRAAITALNPVLLTVVVVLVSLVLIALVSTGVGCVIAAFEAGAEKDANGARAASS